jgi:hypothetical protein
MLLGIDNKESGEPLTDAVTSVLRPAFSLFTFWNMGREETPMDILGDGMTSLQIDPIFGLWGKATGSLTYQEPRAHALHAKREECIQDHLWDGVSLDKSDNCKGLHPRTLKDLKNEMPLWKGVAEQKKLTERELFSLRATNLSANFIKFMEIEKAAIANPDVYARLSTLRRRTLVLQAGYIMQELRDATNAGEPEVAKPYNELLDRYPFLFNDDLLPQLDTPGKRKDFLDEVNDGRAEALRFSYHQ